MLTFAAFLTDSLNTVQPWRWNGGGDDPGARFSIGTLDYQIEFHLYDAEGTADWRMSFNTLGRGQPYDKRDIGITGTGNEFAVFATVIDILKAFINKYQPKVIVFSAEEPSRIRLYDRFVRSVASVIPGYVGSTARDGYYRITRTHEDA